MEKAKAKDIVIGQRIQVWFNGNWEKGLTVVAIHINPYYGWIGFSFEEWVDEGVFNWRGWFEPESEIVVL